MIDEAEMNFTGPVYRIQLEVTVGQITVWKRYFPLLLSLNSLIFTIDHQFFQKMQTVPIDEEIIT